MTIRLVVADDHPLVVQGLRSLLAAERQFHIAATCADGEVAVREVRRHRPDILLLDLRMPKRNGLAVIRELREEGVDVKIVVLTASIHDDEAQIALHVGADALCRKEDPPRLLLRCLACVHGGEPWPDRRTTQTTREPRPSAGDDAASTLTPRETELVRLVASGLTNRDIAARLFITEGTVKLHVHHIFRKLGVRTRVKLTLYARESGLA